MGRQRGTAWTEARAILRRGSGELLIVKTHAADDTPWQFPGGHVPGPALPEESLRRLCLAGLGLELGPLVGQAAFVQRFGTHAVTYLHFVGAVADDQATPLGYAELRWVAPGQLCEYVLDAPSRHMAARLLAEGG
jgi:8-oxo-dGTP pyrophosphatase MutT (NUDIX family)